MTKEELQDFITYTLMFAYLLAIVSFIVGLPIYAIAQAQEAQAYNNYIYERIY